MAEASRDIIMRRLWDTGLLARGLASMNGTDSWVSIKLSDWVNEYNEKDPSFRIVMSALLRLLRKHNAKWLEEYRRDPIKPMPAVSVGALLAEVKSEEEDGASAELSAGELKPKLAQWRDRYLVGYRDDAEMPFTDQGKQTRDAEVQFLSPLFAYMAEQEEAREVATVTRREDDALRRPSGDFGL